MSNALELLEIDAMARPKPAGDDIPDGQLMTENLIRLGYSETTVKTAEVARLVTENAERPMTRQRVSALLNSRRISPAMWQAVADGIGVDVKELRRRPKGAR